MNGFFACVGYTILVADFMQKALEGLAGWDVPRTLLITVNTALFFLPLSQARNLSSLRYTSVLGLSIISMVFLYVVSDSLTHVPSSMVNLKANAMRIDLGLFKMVAIGTTAFQAHYNAPAYFKQLDGNFESFVTTTRRSYATAFFVYLSFATAGVGLFGDRVLGNMLRNYEAAGNTPILLAWLGMAFAVIFTYPLPFTAARDSLLAQAPFRSVMKRNPDLTHAIVSSAMVILISSVACFVEDVSHIAGLLGATTGQCLCFIFPACIYLKLVRRRKQHGNDLEQPLIEEVPSLVAVHPELVFYCSLLVFVGSISMAVGLRNVLYKV